MELFLNLAWLVLSVSLVVLWVKAPRASDRAGQVDRRVQIFALAMLIVILLPVISMTDDMQAMATAEIEHVARRADLLPAHEQPVDLFVPPHAQLFSVRYQSNSQTFARIEPLIENVLPRSGSIRQIASRPPPPAA